jgi:hypothetical protein
MYAPCEIAAPPSDEPEAPFALIPLRNRAGQLVAFALIDAEDEERVGRFRWYRESTGYVSRNLPRNRGARRGRVYLHREVMGLTRGDGLEADHENHRPTDCRKSNLRILPHSGNLQNRRGANRGSTSRYRGVFWDAGRGRWVAQVKVGAVRLRKRCDSEKEAAAVATQWRREHMPYATN